MKYFCNCWAAVAAGGPKAGKNIGDLRDLVGNKNKMFCEDFYKFTLKHQIQPAKGSLENKDIMEHKQEIAKSDLIPLDVNIRSFENFLTAMTWLMKMVEENNNQVPSKENHFQVLVTGSVLPVRNVYYFLNKNI